jgi:Flp pilus assembly CpaF family ATPase
MAYLWLCIENNKSLIFAGGTASGKTTSMNATSMFVPPRANVLTIEDTRELSLYHDNWPSSVTRQRLHQRRDIDMYDLLRSAFRHRPEYIIVGEVRGDEAVTLFQAMNTGHTTFSTMHADSNDRGHSRDRSGRHGGRAAAPPSRRRGSIRACSAGSVPSNPTPTSYCSSTRPLSRGFPWGSWRGNEGDERSPTA